jgi:hypothetical protein
MKTTPLRYSLIGLLALTVLYSCKKESDALKTPQERILGKWSIVRESEKTYHYNTGAFKDSTGVTIPYGAFTIEFRSDGKAYSTITENGAVDQETFDYVLQGESLLLIDGEEYYIQQFTNNRLITTDYYDDGTSDVEHILELRK